MSLSRYAKRRDETEPAIVSGLRKCGYLVHRQDCPDLMVRRPRDGKIFLLEVGGITRNRKRAASQLEFLRAWHVPVVMSFEAALAAVSQ